MSHSVSTCPACQTRNRVPDAAQGLPGCSECQTALPWVAKATDDTWSTVANSERLLVLVDLWAPWCGPCRQVAPHLEKLAAEHAGKLKIVKVNVDENQILSRRFNAQSIPLLVLLKGGKEVGRQLGAQPLPRLRAWVTPHLG